MATDKNNIQANIKNTKDDGIYYECELLGDGTEGNEYRPKIFTYKGYYHLDAKDIDYTNKKVKVWVNKKKTKTTEITKIRNDGTLTKIKETTGGATV